MAPMVGALVLLWIVAARTAEPRRAHVLVACVLSVALLYGTALPYGFVSDDFFFARPLGVRELLSTFYSTWEPHWQANAHYRPVVALSLALDYAVWGAAPWGYHLTNLVLMCLDAVLACALIRRLSDSPWAGLMGALAWIAHPLSASAAAWPNQRTDSVMCLFYLAALFFLSSKPFGSGSACATLAFALLALGSKEMAVTLPAAALVVVLLFRTRDQLRSRLALVALLATIAAGYVLAWMRLFPSKVSANLDALGPRLVTMIMPVWRPLAYRDWWRGRTGDLAVALSVGMLLVASVLVTRLEAVDATRFRVSVRLCALGLAWPLISLPPIFGLANPDAFRLGLLVALGFGLLWAGVALATDGWLGRATLAAALALWLGPPSRASAAAWGPGGFMYQQALGWKADDPSWLPRLDPAMQALFQQQVRDHARPRDRR